jgi:hypothetical protein
MQTLRDYYSWSQHSLWLSSKKGYRDKYVLGAYDVSSKYMQKGKELAEKLENSDSESWGGVDVLGDAIALSLPKLDVAEYELNIMLDDVKVLGYLDSASQDLRMFYEYKTGTTIWDDDRVQNDKQLLFYASLIHEKIGVIPICYLYWAETFKNEETGEIEFKGTIKKFVRAFSGIEITKMKKEILDTYNEIKEYTHSVALIDDAIVEQYLDIKAQIDNLTSILDELKSSVKLTIEENGGKYGESGYGTFTVVEKSEYEYSDNINKLDKEFKAIINKMKTDERKGDIKKTTQSSYIMFKQF